MVVMLNVFKKINAFKKEPEAEKPCQAENQDRN